METLNFYRGFIRTGGADGKEPLMKYDIKTTPDNELLSEADADKCDNYAAVLAPGVLIIDIDDLNHATKALKILSDKGLNVRIVKTSRGIHIYFKAPEAIHNMTHCNLACGITADIKNGYYNGTAILKLDGTKREVIQDCSISELSELPFYFMPVIMSYIRKKIPDIKTLYGMHSGDGRNEALFGYICDCLKSGIQPEDIKELFYIINNFIFDEPLPDAEIESITRKDAVKYYGDMFFFEKKKPLIRNITDFIEHKEHIIKNNGELYIYTDKGIYSNDIKLIEKVIQGYFNCLNSYQRSEIIKNLLLEAIEKPFSDKRYILFANGVYDLNTGKLEPHTHEYIIPNQIPWKYNPDAVEAEIDNAMFDWCCGDAAIYDLIEEIIGYSMIRDNNFRRFFIIVGNKRNGKSIFLKVLTELIGQENCSCVSLEHLDTRFITTLLMNKLVNIGDDIEDTKISRTATLKKLVSGDALTVERKGRDPITLKSYATLIFSANVIPDMDDMTGAVKDRLIIIPFNNYFSGDSDNPDILQELITDNNMEYLILAGLDGLKRLQKNKAFTAPKCVIDMMNHYTISNDPVAAFLDGLKEADIVMHPTTEIYHNYETFCKDHDLKTMSHKMFTRTVNSKRGYKTDTRNINGRKQKVFLHLY